MPLASQVEFYLSDANLPNDKFLLKNMQQSGFGAPVPSAWCGVAD